MFKNSLPLQFNQEILQIILDEETSAEKSGRLTPVQLELIYQEKWFKMFVPKSLAGKGLPLVEALKLQESLAYWDGSLGWTVTLCAGATYFVGFVNEEEQEVLFKDEKSCWGGSGMATGIANWNGENYEVEGFWKYATGTYHNTAFTANCLLFDQGNPVIKADGNHDFASFYFLPEEVEIVSEWDTMGLRSTSSESFRVKNLQVGKDRTYLLQPEKRTLNEPIFTVPFMTFAELTLAANYLGIFKRLIDETYAICNKKPDSIIPQEILNAYTYLSAKSTDFYKLAEEVWLVVNKNGEAMSDEIKEVSKFTHEMVHDGLQICQLVFVYSGMQGASRNSQINRVWRNLNTASQHSMFRKK